MAARMWWLGIVVAAGICGRGNGQEPAVPGTGIPQGLFQLREMDMHLHAGLERQVGLDAWIDTAVADGRRVIVLLDHLELYRMSPTEFEEWSAKRDYKPAYAMGEEGHRALMRDFEEAEARRRDVILFRGWEIFEGELASGLEEAPMRLAEIIGWHISPRNGRKAPDGTDLLERVRQIKEAQQRFPVPMIVFHPFSMRLENLERTAQAQGRDPKSLTVEECRFFQPGQQEELVRLLKGSSVYIEMAHGTDRYFEQPVMREALIADIKPLADAGVQFTVSTDHHTPANAAKPFEPERYCEPCGITPANTNTIVRELLALRARARLEEKKGE